MAGRSRAFAWPLAVGVALALAVPAQALAVDYVGKTSQGKDFNLRTDKAGVPERASYGWDQGCTGSGTLSNGATVSKFDGRSAKEFSSSGKYESEIERNFQGHFRVRFSGERLSDSRLRGTFKITAKVFKKRSGKLVTKCSTGIVRWTANLKP